MFTNDIFAKRLSLLLIFLCFVSISKKVAGGGGKPPQRHPLRGS